MRSAEILKKHGQSEANHIREVTVKLKSTFLKFATGYSIVVSPNVLFNPVDSPTRIDSGMQFAFRHLYVPIRLIRVAYTLFRLRSFSQPNYKT